MGAFFTLPNIGILDVELDVDVIIEDATCNGLGSITLQALNVVPQYYFEISGPSTDSHGPLMDNNHTFENLNPGSYTITVTTDDGCSYTDTAVVEDRSHLTVAAFVTQNVSCTSGFIGFTPAGGQEPYEYAVYSYNGVMQNPDITDFTDANPFEILPGAEGTYVFIMQDYNGCTVLSNEVEIENMPEVQYTTDFENISCNGANDGIITFDVTATNGFGVSFELLAADDGEPLGANNSGVFTGLAPGDYIVNLLQEGTETCSFPTNFTITEPAAITATASVTQPFDCNTMGATITVDTGMVSGGTAPYEYSINGVTFGATTSFSGLTAGTYTITVRDDSGCIFQTSAITIDPLTPPTDITFAPDLNSDVTLTVTGGVAPFTYEITAPASAIMDNGNNAVFTDLDPGTYTFLVTDDNGCTFQKNHTINNITQIDVNGQPVSNVTCFGQANGSLTFNVSGFSTNYDYNGVGVWR